MIFPRFGISKHRRINPGLLVFSVVCGIILAALLWRESSYGQKPPPARARGDAAGNGEEWAVLSFDEAEDDRQIAEALEAGGFDVFFSESNQNVYLNDFDRIKAVSLDAYGEAVESFDPRNDGYAEKLKALFVRGGRRYFFVSLDGSGGLNGLKLNGLKENFFPRGAERRFRRALGEFPFKVEFAASQKTFFLNLLAGAAAVFFGLMLSGGRRRSAVLLPLLLAFACAASAGLVLAALLMGIHSLASGSLEELFPRRAYGTFGKRFKPYALHFGLSLALVFFFCLLCRAESFPVLPAAAGFFFFILLEAFSFAAERKTGAARFEPVRMLPGRAKIKPWRLSMIPFAAAALALLLQPLLFPALSFYGREPGFVVEDFVSPFDYEKHLAFQRAFSRIPLDFSGAAAGVNGNADGGAGTGVAGGGAYLRYYLGEDGLIAGAVPASSLHDNDVLASAGISPSFPLEKLRAFLVEYREEAGASPFALIEWIPVVLLLIICVPNRYPRGNLYSGRKKAAFFRARWIGRVRIEG